ncbi:MAG: phosphotransferase [Betaproteobacteria bacterium]|nr:phosphotransferase [Betaproteobacteria bacterium]
MDRSEQLRLWVCDRLGAQPENIARASEDASFRRYFRIAHEARTLIAMDAPPPQENCAAFVHVAGLFGRAGVNVPRILAQDLERGFLLLTDFGATTYLQALPDADVERLYRDALQALVRIQVATTAGALPEYDAALLRDEVALFPDWYVERHLGRVLAKDQRERLERMFDALIAHNLAEPRVYVHRDYHSRNLMLTEPNPGILDFQDAVLGPLSYDLVSLLKDAYVEWPEERVIDWAVRYWELARRAGLPVRADFAEFYRDFEWMGVQRHLKVLGIFARLCHRDGKARYLDDLPLVLRYLERAASRYRELKPLARLLDELHGRTPRLVDTF